MITVMNRRILVRFDGRLPHKVQNIMSGWQFSFLYYKTYDRALGCATPVRRDIIACTVFSISVGGLRDVMKCTVISMCVGVLLLYCRCTA